MARHKKDERTARLLAEIESTRTDLKTIVDGLTVGGASQAEIARAASWSASYLGQFLNGSGQRPTTKKTEALIEALRPFVETSSNAALTEPLRRLADRYETAATSLANPTSGPIAVAAPNYICRRNLESLLDINCSMKGDYALAGEPMVGVSSALLYVEARLKRLGYVVRRMSAGTELIASRYGQDQKSRTGILGLVAAALTGSNEPLDLEFFRVQEVIRDHLAEADGPVALIIDDINQLQSSDVESLKLLMRDWATKRAAQESPYADLMTWSAMTSNVRDARFLSNFLASYTVLSWFEKDEVRNLAAALAPYSVVRGVVESGRWPAQVTQSAWSLFGGQPHLTHLFLWDRHLDGNVDRGSALTEPSTGGYERHIYTIVRSLLGLLGRPAALALIEQLSGAERSVSLSDLASAESLGIVGPDNKWRCAYYEEHLPDAVRRMAGSAAV